MIENALIISLVCLFINACTWEGMVLSFIPDWFWMAPVWLKKPLYDCAVCMSPWWGSLLLFISGSIAGTYPHWYCWLLELCIAGGFNVVFSSIINPDMNGSSSTGSDN